MAAERNARALGSASVVQSGTRAVLVSLPPAQAAGARGTITLYRASDAAADRILDLALDTGGRQAISLAGLQAGHWTVQVRWTAEGREFYLEQPVLAR
jgi:hypothetical protein